MAKAPKQPHADELQPIDLSPTPEAADKIEPSERRDKDRKGLLDNAVRAVVRRKN